jgi:hypothetical protein
MGRMKELCIDIMNANDGELPPELTSGDVLKMYKLKIYNWDEYNKTVAEADYNKKDLTKFDWETDKRENKTQEEPF